LADPGPVIQSFFTDEVLHSQTQLDAIITIVDAKHIWEHFDSSEAQEQIAFADRLLINKTDLVTAEELAKLEKRVRQVNVVATIHRTQNCEVNMIPFWGFRLSTCGMPWLSIQNCSAILLTNMTSPCGR
jgi:G3E family GTPase